MGRTLGLKETNGLAFFEFPDDNPVSVRTHMKGNVNAMDMDQETIDRMIKEKEIVFSLNNGIAAEVKLSIWSFRRLALLGFWSVVGCYGVVMLLKVISSYMSN